MIFLLYLDFFNFFSKTFLDQIFQTGIKTKREWKRIDLDMTCIDIIF